MLSVIEIAEFCKDELEKTFNESFDIYEDKIIEKILYILFDSFEIDYNIEDDFLIAVLENLKSLKLGNLKKDEFGNIIQDISDFEKNELKNYILYIVSFHTII